MIGADGLALLGLGAVVVVLAVLLAVAWRTERRERARSEAALEATRAEAAALATRVDALAARLETRGGADRPDPDRADYVITGLGTPETPEPRAPERIEGRLFADIVLRESVVRAASLGHGVRRALAPETRNRIRFEMRRDIKRSRKQRRREVRDLRRQAQREAQ